MSSKQLHRFLAIFILQVNVLMVKCALLMELMILKVELKFVCLRNGEQSVITAGQQHMLKLSVVNLDYRQQV